MALQGRPVTAAPAKGDIPAASIGRAGVRACTARREAREVKARDGRAGGPAFDRPAWPGAASGKGRERARRREGDIRPPRSTTPAGGLAWAGVMALQGGPVTLDAGRKGMSGLAGGLRQSLDPAAAAGPRSGG
jgi:hypothetical protein